MSLSTLNLDEIVHRALEEDIANGDVTSDACVDVSTRSRAKFVARESIVVCGLELISRVYAQIDEDVVINTRAHDGDRLEPDALLAEVTGRARSLLLGERIALNFVQRMSGVATLTRQYVDALPRGSKTRITDTRKTTPGLRVLERYAVRVGGGVNHRNDLSSAVLIKDNHIAAAGGIRLAIERARAHAPHTTRIECEVDNLAGLDEALAAGADIVMLDNFDNQAVAKAVETTRGRAILEVSGSMTLERIRETASLGIDVISVGKLTHSARAVDIGLDWVE